VLPGTVVELVVAPRATLATTFAGRCGDLAAEAIRARGTFGLAIPGGSVAEAFVPALAVATVDWQRTHLYWCDERAVPVDDQDSNYGRARQLFEMNGISKLPHEHPMPADTIDLTAAADAYARVLESTLGCPPMMDVLLAGVGEDGHICSLFPGHAALEARARWVVAVEDAPKPPPRRLTFTMPMVEAARILCVAAFGQGKARVMRAALDDPGADTPVALALRASRAAWVMLDEAAAGVGP
jgi:6-phosphogluconolactonase